MLNILLVEDDKDDQQFFKEAIDRLGLVNNLTILPECQGVEGLISKRKKFDIIFMDINLPKMDGKMCLKSLKSNAAYKDIPVIMFTVSNALHDINEVFETGAHFYVIKPHARLNLIATLKLIFENNWKQPPPRPEKEKFVIDMTYS